MSHRTLSATNPEAIVHTQAAVFAEISREVLLVFGIAMKLFAYGNDLNKVILALRLELVIAYQVSGDYSSASVTV